MHPINACRRLHAHATRAAIIIHHPRRARHNPAAPLVPTADAASSPGTQNHARVRGAPPAHSTQVLRRLQDQYLRRPSAKIALHASERWSLRLI